MFRLMRERPEDGPEVEWLLDLAFAPGRTALSSYRLREGVAPVAELCTVARDDYDALAGCIRYWPVQIGRASCRERVVTTEVEVLIQKWMVTNVCSLKTTMC